ncbi:MAG TPA: L,D-transpeptidase family protein [Chitinophagales bacterium]|nr:L,D-transpeptidase family protein [Chitinophagales bacterium]
MNFFKAGLWIAVLAPLLAAAPGQPGFEELQKRNKNVAEVYDRKEELIKMRCRSLEIPDDSFGNILIRVFKAEALLEVWVQKPDGKYVEFNEYKIYATSGRLGPKREEGDMQVPEGYYYIRDFKPNSNYYMALGINYPNQSDEILSDAEHKGEDIYIHGNHVSAGCMAMSNYYIEDIYICAVKARNYGQQQIPVEIFPFRPTIVNFAYFNQFLDCKPYERFWKNLAEGYNFFEKHQYPPDVSVDTNGKYIFTDPKATQATK